MCKPWSLSTSTPQASPRKQYVPPVDNCLGNALTSRYPGPIPLLARHPTVRPVAAVPRCAHHGERHIQEQRQAERARQVAEELLPLLLRRLLRCTELLRRRGPGQVRLVRRQLRLVCHSAPCLLLFVSVP